MYVVLTDIEHWA